MKWKEEIFPTTHDERIRMQAQQFEKAMQIWGMRICSFLFRFFLAFVQLYLSLFDAASCQVMREVKSHPDFGQFVGAGGRKYLSEGGSVYDVILLCYRFSFALTGGLQMKLLCQLGFILAAMCLGSGQTLATIVGCDMDRMTGV